MGAVLGNMSQCVRGGGGRSVQAGPVQQNGQGCASMDGCQNGINQIFFEPEGAVTKENYQWVGEGQGGYEKLQSYNFVGDGQGAYGQSVDNQAGVAFKRCCQCLFTLCLLLALAYVALALNPDLMKKAQQWVGQEVDQLSMEDTDAAEFETPVVMTTATTTTTQAGLALRGVAATTPQADIATTVKPLFDCSAGSPLDLENRFTSVDRDGDGQISLEELDKQSMSFTAEQMAMIRDADIDQDGHLGKEEFSAALAEAGVTTGISHATESVNGWSDEKKTWCCQHESIGCAAVTPQVKEDDENAFDCSGDDMAWGLEQKEWCCDREPGRQGCTAEPYDCSQAFDTWERAWTPAKKEWCCENKVRGCPNQAREADLPAQDPEELRTYVQAEFTVQNVNYDALMQDNGIKEEFEQAVRTNFVKADGGTADMISIELKEGSVRVFVYISHALHGHGVTTMDDVTSSLSEASNLEAEIVKSVRAVRGIEQVTSGSIEISGSLAVRKMTTSEEDLEKAPEKETLETPETPAYFCDVDPPETWSQKKKAWCCKNEKKGCAAEQGKPSGGELYQCRDNAAKWDAHQALWCCQKENIGCAVLKPISSPACLTQCNFQGQAFPCGHRLIFEARHKYDGVENQCALAREEVLEQCPVCSQCSLQDAGCTGVLPPLFNCSNTVGWQAKWSMPQKEFCCQVHGVGCAAPTAPEFDCEEKQAQDKAKWSMPQKQFCCQVHGAGVGCAELAAAATAPTAPEFDCEENFLNYEEKWSLERKAWCCKTLRRACPTSSTTTTSTTIAAVYKAWHRDTAEKSGFGAPVKHNLTGAGEPASLAKVKAPVKSPPATATASNATVGQAGQVASNATVAPVKPSPKPSPTPATVALVAPPDPWKEVEDKTSGKTYWWNQQTNQTTALGAPKPSPAALASQAVRDTTPSPAALASQAAVAPVGQVAGAVGQVAGAVTPEQAARGAKPSTAAVAPVGQAGQASVAGAAGQAAAAPVGQAAVAPVGQVAGAVTTEAKAATATAAASAITQ